MSIVYKIIAYLAVSLLLGFAFALTDNAFFTGFQANIISLLATLLAINITTSALITGELNKLKYQYPNANLSDSNIALKQTFKIQIVLLLSLIVWHLVLGLILKYSHVDKYICQTLANAATIGVFLYYIETIYGLGIALFKIISHNTTNKPE